ncbi:MAG: NUDIX domain-containing protein [Candidatus Micrarchaeia archaeon]
MGEFHRVALIVFYDESNRILLQDRHSKHPRQPWGFFGGHIKPNETPEDALVRETREELGWKLEGEQEFLGEFNSECGRTRIQMFVYIAPLGDKLDKFVLNEGDGMRLFTLDEADEIQKHMNPWDGNVLQALRKKLEG